jgi:hypothetical protein
MDISGIFVLVRSEDMQYSTPLKTIQPSISNWLHSTLLMFNPHMTPVRLINKTLLLQKGITQQRNGSSPTCWHTYHDCWRPYRGGQWTFITAHTSSHFKGAYHTEILRGRWDRGEKMLPNLTQYWRQLRSSFVSDRLFKCPLRDYDSRHS